MYRFFSLALLCCGLAVLLNGQGANGISVQQLLQRYTENYGGVRDANRLSSVSMEGVQIQGEVEYDFHLHRKRPASMRYQLEKDDAVLTSVYNGQKGWLRVLQDGEVRVEELAGARLRMLRKEARFESPLYRHLEKPENEIKLIGRQLIDGVEVIVLRVKERGNAVSLFYLHPEKAHVQRIDRLDDKDEVVFQTLYRDYREVSGYPFAHEIENRVNGETVSLTKLETVVVNPGLLSFYFDNPGS